MPDIVFIAYYYPPLISSGTNRSAGFASLLPEFGFNPRVLTVKHSQDPWTGLDSTYKDMAQVFRTLELPLAPLCELAQGATSRLLRLLGKELKRNYFRDFLCLPDPQIAWFSTLKGLELSRGASLIYASCSPFSSALSALLISKLAKLPLVLDFRDPWTINPHLPLTPLSGFVIRRLERLAVRHCSRLILNTSGSLRKYRELYPEHAEKMLCIPNGYDVRFELPAERRTNQFNILHLGSFYGSRQPRLLLEAMQELPQLPLRLLQVGGEAEVSAEQQHLVEVLPQLPRAEAWKYYHKASLLYLKQGFEHGLKEEICVPAKTYEYLSTGLGILAETPEGDVAELLRRYSNRHYLVLSEDKEEMKRCLIKAYQEQPANIRPEASEKFLSEFSRENLCKQLAAVFSEVIASS